MVRLLVAAVFFLGAKVSFIDKVMKMPCEPAYGCFVLFASLPVIYATEPSSWND
jgi:hypothetical protein